MKSLNIKKSEYSSLSSTIILRDKTFESDRESIRTILESNGCFHKFEIDTAISLFDERIIKGGLSGYNFLFAEKQNILLGYSCYGPIPCTKSSYDIYWIAINKKFCNQGIGTYLMNETEKRIVLDGGSNVYIETSNREIYKAARSLYCKCDYSIAAILPDFYDVTDDKIIFKKILTKNPAAILPTEFVNGN